MTAATGNITTYRKREIRRIEGSQNHDNIQILTIAEVVAIDSFLAIQMGKRAGGDFVIDIQKTRRAANVDSASEAPLFVCLFVRACVHVVYEDDLRLL